MSLEIPYQASSDETWHIGDDENVKTRTLIWSKLKLFTVLAMVSVTAFLFVATFKLTDKNLKRVTSLKTQLSTLSVNSLDVEVPYLRESDFVSKCYQDICGVQNDQACWPYYNSGCCPSSTSGVWDNSDWGNYMCNDNVLPCIQTCNNGYRAGCGSCQAPSTCQYATTGANERGDGTFVCAPPPPPTPRPTPKPNPKPTPKPTMKPTPSPTPKPTMPQKSSFVSQCYDDICGYQNGLACWQSGCCPDPYSGLWDNPAWGNYMCDNSVAPCVATCNIGYEACTDCNEPNACYYVTTGPLDDSGERHGDGTFLCLSPESWSKTDG